MKHYSPIPTDTPQLCSARFLQTSPVAEWQTGDLHRKNRGKHVVWICQLISYKCLWAQFWDTKVQNSPETGVTNVRNLSCSFWTPRRTPPTSSRLCELKTRSKETEREREPRLRSFLLTGSAIIALSWNDPGQTPVPLQRWLLRWQPIRIGLFHLQRRGEEKCWMECPSSWCLTADYCSYQHFVLPIGCLQLRCQEVVLDSRGIQDKPWWGLISFQYNTSKKITELLSRLR